MHLNVHIGGDLEGREVAPHILSHIGKVINQNRVDVKGSVGLSSDAGSIGEGSCGGDSERANSRSTFTGDFLLLVSSVDVRGEWIVGTSPARRTNEFHEKKEVFTTRA